jgi:hypothetical protein
MVHILGSSAGFDAHRCFWFDPNRIGVIQAWTLVHGIHY